MNKLAYAIAVLSTTAVPAAAQGSEEYQTPGFVKSFIENSVGFAINATFEAQCMEFKTELKPVDSVCAMVSCENNAEWLLTLRRYEHGLVGSVALPAPDGVRMQYLPNKQVSAQILELTFRELLALKKKHDSQEKPVENSPWAVERCKLKACIKTGTVTESFEIKGFIRFPVNSAAQRLIDTVTRDVTRGNGREDDKNNQK